MATTESRLDGKIRAVRLVIFDVDGVLTDGRITFDSRGVETKSFDVKDGHGIKLLARCGLDAAIITARESSVVERRAAELGISLVFQGAKDKRQALEAITARTGLQPGSMAYMGDDIIDLPVLRRVGLSATVSDAVQEVREMADFVSSRPGGSGAARELIELILKGQGRWADAIGRYLD